MQKEDKIEQDRQSTYNITLRRAYVNIVVVKKAKSVTYYECVVLVIQHAKTMRRVLLCVHFGCTTFLRIIP
jgi:hypothetical protein